MELRYVGVDTATTAEAPRTIALSSLPLTLGRKAAAGAVSVTGPNHIAKGKLLSRKHAIIAERPDGALSVMDLGSVNGSYLDGVKLTPRSERAFPVGGILALGARSVVEYELHQVGDSASATADGAKLIGAPADHTVDTASEIDDPSAKHVAAAAEVVEEQKEEEDARTRVSVPPPEEAVVEGHGNTAQIEVEDEEETRANTRTEEAGKTASAAAANATEHRDDTEGSLQGDMAKAKAGPDGSENRHDEEQADVESSMLEEATPVTQDAHELNRDNHSDDLPTREDSAQPSAAAAAPEQHETLSPQVQQNHQPSHDVTRDRFAAEEHDEKLAVPWFWKGDKGGRIQNCWVAYNSDMSRKLEDAHRKALAEVLAAAEAGEDQPGAVRIKVDEERFVELAPKGKASLEKSQHRYDDESKWRPVQRRPSAAKQKQRKAVQKQTEAVEDARASNTRRTRGSTMLSHTGHGAGEEKEQTGRRKRARITVAEPSPDDNVEDSEDQSQVF